MKILKHSLMVVVISILILTLVTQIGFGIIANKDLKRVDEPHNLGETIKYSMLLQDNTFDLALSFLGRDTNKPVQKYARIDGVVYEQNDWLNLEEGEIGRRLFTNVYFMYDLPEFETVQLDGINYIKGEPDGIKATATISTYIDGVMVYYRLVEDRE